MTMDPDPAKCNRGYNLDGENDNFDGPEFCDRKKGHRGEHESHWSDRNHYSRTMISWLDGDVGDEGSME